MPWKLSSQLRRQWISCPDGRTLNTSSPGASSYSRKWWMITLGDTEHPPDPGFNPDPHRNVLSVTLTGCCIADTPTSTSPTSPPAGKTAWPSTLSYTNTGEKTEFHQLSLSNVNTLFCHSFSSFVFDQTGPVGIWHSEEVQPHPQPPQRLQCSRTKAWCDQTVGPWR